MRPRSGAKPPIRKSKQDQPSKGHGIAPSDTPSTSSLLQTGERALEPPLPHAEPQNRPRRGAKSAVDEHLTELGRPLAEHARRLAQFRRERASRQRTPAEIKAKKDAIAALGLRTFETFRPESSSNLVPTSPRVDRPETETYDPTMVEDDRIITKQGNRYFPISLAAEFAQVPRTTLLNWIKAKVEFQGRRLETYNSPTARKAYLTEESVQRLADRFVKWPSNAPAGQVVIGETDDHSGYIGIAKAARAIGVAHHTIWLWVTQGNAPTDRPLDIIKCSASNQFYIREKEVSEIKKLFPPSGVPRGRRPQLMPQP